MDRAFLLALFSMLIFCVTTPNKYPSKSKHLKLEKGTHIVETSKGEKYLVNVGNPKQKTKEKSKPKSEDSEKQEPKDVDKQASKYKYDDGAKEKNKSKSDKVNDVEGEDYFEKEFENKYFPKKKKKMRGPTTLIKITMTEPRNSP